MAKKILEAADDRQALQAIYDQADHDGALTDFQQAVAAARRHKGSDLLHYWHYRLKIEQQSEPAKKTSSHPDRTKKILGLSLGISQPAVSWFSGLLSGLLIWFWLEYNDSGILRDLFGNSDEERVFAIALLIFSVGYTQYLLKLSSARKSGLIRSGITAILYLLLWSCLTYLPNQNQSLPWLKSFTLLGTSFLFYWLTIFLARGDKKKKGTRTLAAQFVRGFARAVYKLLEITCLAILLYGAYSAITGIFLGLLSIIRIDLASEIVNLLFCVGFVVSPFLATSLTYDFSKDLDQQASPFAGKNIISLISGFLTYPITIFLLVYIAILAPTQFKLILNTGQTVPIFTGCIIVCNIIIFWLPTHLEGISEKKRTTWNTMLIVLYGELLLLSGVASYALLVRIQAYALTSERILGMIFLLLTLILHLYYLWSVLTKRNKDTELAATVRSRQNGMLLTSLSLLGVGIIISLAVDLDLVSARSQIRRIKQANDVEIMLDRYYFQNLGLAEARLLEQEYTAASPTFKADIALTLFAMKERWQMDEEDQNELDAILASLSEQEQDENLQELLQVMSERDSLQNWYTQKYGPTYSDACVPYIAELLELDEDQAFYFCYQYDPYPEIDTMSIPARKLQPGSSLPLSPISAPLD